MACAVRYMPLGVANAIGTGACVMFSALLDAFYFHEQFSPPTLSLIGCIVIGNLLLGSVNSRENAATATQPVLGLMFSLIFGLTLSVALIALSEAARHSDPYVVAWAWESSIGYMSVLFLILRSAVGFRALIPISRRQFFKIMLCCSPTLIGTGCYTMALTYGSMAIATAITSGQMVGITVIAHFAFGERTTRLEWLLISFVFIAVLGLNMAP
jgi:drug/metabolite transporter (DMT)-like permease